MGLSTLVLIILILYIGLQAYIHNKEKMKIVFGMLILVFTMFNLTFVDERYMFLKIEKIKLSNGFLVEIIDDLFRISRDTAEFIGVLLFLISLVIIWKTRLKTKLFIDRIIEKV